jgi:hypothetical protein
MTGPGMTAEERVARVHPRQCGECNLCCKLLPVQNLHPANQWCQHAVKGHGCGIYPDRPVACRAFACMWLSGEELPDELKRPDKAHYVIDEAADIIGVNGEQRGCLQVWADPGYPTAWRTDAALRGLILWAAENGAATLIRFGSIRGRLVLAPPLSPMGVWEEHESVANRPEFTEAEKVEFFNKREHR